MNAMTTCAKRCSTAAVLAAAILSSGCIRLYQSWNVSRFDSEIRKAGAAIAAASTDAQRATAYADRGDAYCEKARYSRLMKLITIEEYERLFQLAIRDHNQAIALDQENADLYYRRGSAYYDHASLDMIYNPKATAYLIPARADFSKAVEKNPKHAMAFDMLGLTDSSLRDWTAAVADFEQEAKLNPDSRRYRLSDAYCNRGYIYVGEKKYDLAESDLNHAIEIRSEGDPCECEPYNPLLAMYLSQTHEYDKARAVAAKARASKSWIAPEYVAQLKGLGEGR